MKKKIAVLIPFVLVLAADFYLLPLLARDTGMAMLMMLCVMPLAAFSCGVVYGVQQGFDFFLTIAAVVLFTPTIFTYYNSTAWVYIIVYGAITLAGNGVGRIFYKKR